MSKKKTNKISLFFFLFSFIFILKFNNSWICYAASLPQNISDPTAITVEEDVVTPIRDETHISVNPAVNNNIQESFQDSWSKFFAIDLKSQKKIARDAPISVILNIGIFLLQIFLNQLIITKVTEGQRPNPGNRFPDFPGFNQIFSYGKAIVLYGKGIVDSFAKWVIKDMTGHYKCLQFLSFFILQNLGPITVKIFSLFNYRLELPGVDQLNFKESIFYNLMVASVIMGLINTKNPNAAESIHNLMGNILQGLSFLQLYIAYSSIRTIAIFIALLASLVKFPLSQTIVKTTLLGKNIFNNKTKVLLILATLYNVCCYFSFPSKIEMGIFFSKLFLGILGDALITLKSVQHDRNLMQDLFLSLVFFFSFCFMFEVPYMPLRYNAKLLLPLETKLFHGFYRLFPFIIFACRGVNLSLLMNNIKLNIVFNTADNIETLCQILFSINSIMQFVEIIEKNKTVNKYLPYKLSNDDYLNLTNNIIFPTLVFGDFALTHTLYKDRFRASLAVDKMKQYYLLTLIPLQHYWMLNGNMQRLCAQSHKPPVDLLKFYYQAQVENYSYASKNSNR
jgi:hypothetical protein